MTHFGPVVFNLLVNGAVDFVFSLLLVLLSVRVLRVKNRALLLFLLSLPCVKILTDVVRGIPSDSYIFSSLNYFALPQGLLRCFYVDIGEQPFGLDFRLRMGIATKCLGPGAYSVSAADVLFTWLSNAFGSYFMTALPFALLGGSCIHLLRRGREWMRFERMRRLDRRSCPQIARIRLKFRVVDVYTSSTYSGTPFTGGLWRPYICFPALTYAELTDQERAAVLGHELAHIRHFDIPQSCTLQILGDIFWFAPFFRSLTRRLERLREIVADQAAAPSTEEQLVLASALIKLHTMLSRPLPAALYAPFAPRRPLLRERLQLLAADGRTAPAAWIRRIADGVFAITIVAVVFGTRFVDNYPVADADPGPDTERQSKVVADFFKHL